MLLLPPIKHTLYFERLEVAGDAKAFERAQRTGLAAEELAYLKAGIESGKLVLGGELADPMLGGVYVYKAASLNEARDIARARPFNREGLTKSTVLEWEVRYFAPLS